MAKKILTLMVAMVFMLIFAPMSNAATKRITLTDNSWDSIQVHNRIVGFILEHGYGYSVNYVFAETSPSHLGLQRGDMDVNMEIWEQNVKEWLDSAVEAGDVLIAGANFSDAPQGWYVPTYVIEGDPERGIEPMAPDLKTVEDLPRYKDLFKSPTNPDKGRFYNCPTGWLVFSVNNAKLEAYGLDRHFESFAPGSDTALSTAILTAYRRGDAILAYYWEPTWLMGMLDMTMIEEPPYDEALWNEENKWACSYPPANVLIGINSGYAKKHPEVLDLLQKYETTVDQNNAFLAYMYEHEASTQEAAIWFLKKYKDTLKSFVEDQEIIEKVEKALANY